MKMTDSEKNLEEIFEEYLLLLQDGQYHEVIYDEESGGVSAIHQKCAQGRFESLGDIPMG